MGPVIQLKGYILGATFEVSKYSALQKNWTFLGFPYKMTRGAMVENHLKIMLNPPIFSQMLVSMYEAD